MTPKEKANELLHKYWGEVVNFNTVDYGKSESIKCALIAVDEIIIAIDWHEFETPNNQFEYWDEVKKKLEAMK